MANDEAVKRAAEAVEHDTAGRWEAAVQLYEMAADLLAADPSDQAAACAPAFRALFAFRREDGALPPVQRANSFQRSFIFVEANARWCVRAQLAGQKRGDW